MARGLAVLGAGLMMAAAVALWFTNNPVMVTTELKPLPVSQDMPSFKPVAIPLQRP